MSGRERLRPVGERALSLETGEGDDEQASARVRALAADLDRDPPPGLQETVPGLRALLVVFDPARTTSEEIGAEVRARLERAAFAAPTAALHTIRVHYGGADGPTSTRSPPAPDSHLMTSSRATPPRSTPR